ncbi:MAG: TolC family protein [Flavobacteriales bacterium]|jgi:outer membrane protein TolC|nr:TolC family protein [Flavobacteriales bacterium]
MKNNFYAILFLLLVKSSFSQQSFTLKQAQDYALEHNQEVLNADLDLQIAEKKVWETTASGLPQISAKGELQNFIDIPTTVLPANAFNPMAPADELVGVKFGTDYNVTGTLQVSQLLFSGNYLVGLQAAKTYTSLSKQMKDKSEQEVKSSVANAYYTVLVLQENVVTLDSTLLKMKELLKTTQILVDNKVMESTNASQLRLSVLQVENGITKVKSQLEVSYSLLKMEMGMDLTTAITLADTYADITNSAANYADEKFASANNIDYQLLETQLKLNELSLKNTKANYLPSLAAFLSHQQVAMRNDFDFFDGDKDWFPTTVWGLTLNIPIFSSGQRASQVSQAKLEVQKTENTMAQLDKGLQLQYIQFSSQYNSAKDAFETQQQAVAVAKEILNSTEIKYKEGVVSSMELTQAQNQLLQAQTDLTNAGFELIKAKLDLDKLFNKFNQ